MPSGQCLAERFPWVNTYHQKAGFRKCYELTDLNEKSDKSNRDKLPDGKVLVRVTRWDEDHQAAVKFNNKAPLWDFRFSNPAVRGPAPSAAGLAACQGLGKGGMGAYILNPSNSAPVADKQAVNGAFMLNAPSSAGAAQCWSTVEQLLSHGVKTTVCAEYKGIETPTNHMEVKFVSCPPGAFDENKTLGN